MLSRWYTKWQHKPQSSSFLKKFVRQLIRTWFSVEIWWYIYYQYQSYFLNNRPIKNTPFNDGSKTRFLRKCLSELERIAQAVRDPSKRELLSRMDRSGSVETALRSLGANERDTLIDLEGSNMETNDPRSSPRQNELDDETVSVSTVTSDRDALILSLKEISSWFFGAPLSAIHRGNVESWLGWALWGHDTKDVMKDPDDQVIMEECIALITEWTHHKFAPGYNSEVNCVRLTLDPIHSSYRPLTSYLVTEVGVGFATYGLLAHYLGFTRYEVGHLTYWYRGPETRSENEQANDVLPIVFCHGLGVGILPYISLISHFPRNVPIFLIELPHIAMRIAPSVPSPSEIVGLITEMLGQWNVTKAHFMGHSFGTCVMAWVTKRAPWIIAKATFIDPVVFLLCKSNVALNFVYKGERTLMDYFVAQELYIAHTLSRHFIWHNCILWIEDLACYEQGSVVAVSGTDFIVPSLTVALYLKDAETTDVLMFPNYGHAQFLTDSKAVKMVIKKAFANKSSNMKVVPPNLSPIKSEDEIQENHSK
eukprot:g4089.t1